MAPQYQHSMSAVSQYGAKAAHKPGSVPPHDCRFPSPSPHMTLRSSDARYYSREYRTDAVLRSMNILESESYCHAGSSKVMAQGPSWPQPLLVLCGDLNFNGDIDMLLPGLQWRGHCASSARSSPHFHEHLAQTNTVPAKHNWHTHVIQGRIALQPTIHTAPAHLREAARCSVIIFAGQDWEFSKQNHNVDSIQNTAVAALPSCYMSEQSCSGGSAGTDKRAKTACRHESSATTQGAAERPGQLPPSSCVVLARQSSRRCSTGEHCGLVPQRDMPHCRRPRGISARQLFRAAQAPSMADRRTGCQGPSCASKIGHLALLATCW